MHAHLQHNTPRRPTTARTEEDEERKRPSRAWDQLSPTTRQFVKPCSTRRTETFKIALPPHQLTRRNKTLCNTWLSFTGWLGGLRNTWRKEKKKCSIPSIPNLVTLVYESNSENCHLIDDSDFYNIINYYYTVLE